METASVTVITTNILERKPFLDACIESVKKQTLLPQAHIICTDIKRVGPYGIRTQFGLACQTEWLLYLDDDDVLLPTYFERMFAHDLSGASVAYSDWEMPNKKYYQIKGRPFNEKALSAGNYIPITALIRTKDFIEIGGFPTVKRYGDWKLWIALAKADKKFIYVPEKLWEYRLHGSSVTITGKLK